MNSFNANELREKLVRSLVPAHLHEGIAGYVCYSYRPGGFLSSVLSNDLSGACMRADEYTRPHLYDVVCFLHNHVPSCCWGSVNAFENWLGPYGANTRVAARRADGSS